jgi:hypothetical protein
MQYTVITECNTVDFEAHVQIALNAGWEPQGGVAVNTRINIKTDGVFEMVTEYVQALVLRK